MRILAWAYSDLDSSITERTQEQMQHTCESDLTFLCVVAIDEHVDENIP